MISDSRQTSSSNLPIDRGRRDVDITHDAVDALIWDTDVPEKIIIARVKDGWIWLLGHADAEQQRAATERAVGTISGVKRATNLIRLAVTAKHVVR